MVIVATLTAGCKVIFEPSFLGVTDAKFGEGMIVNIESSGADARMQVNFRKTGTKVGNPLPLLRKRVGLTLRSPA